MKQYFVLDIGGTDIKYALMNENAEIIFSSKHPTIHNINYQLFLEIIDEIINPYLETISGIAISMPGRINVKTGYAYSSGALGYLSNLNIKELFEERYHKTTFVENDGKACALAELWKGNLQGVDNGVVLVLGTAIGGGIIINGRLYRGFNQAAGEFSAICVDFKPPMTHHSYWALLSGSLGGLVLPFQNALNLPKEKANGKEFFALLKENNPICIEIFDQYIINLVTGIYNLQTILDVQRFCIGGGISAQDCLIEAIQKASDAYYEQTKDSLPMVKPEIERCKFNNDANLIGALKNFLDQNQQ